MMFRRIAYPMSLLLLASAVSGCSLIRDLGVGKGFSAKYLCSAVFTSGMQEEAVIENFIKPKVRQLPWFWNVDVDHETRQVTVGDMFTGAGSAQTAIYTEGKGCTLLVDKTREDVEALGFTPLPAPAVTADAEWPVGELMFEGNAEGVDMPRLEAAINATFDEKWESALNTTSVLVVHKGHIIAEQYDNGASVDTPLLGRPL